MIVITEFMDQAAVERLAGEFETVYDPDLVDRPDEMGRAIAAARALIVRNRTQVTSDLLAQAPSLACVGRLGVGLDNIDLSACEAGGIVVFPATGANNRSVAEYVVSSAMVLLRGTAFASGSMLSGNWPRQTLGSGREVSGKTLGLVGFGAIAQLTAELAHGLGMATCAHDPFIADDDAVWTNTQSMDLESLLRTSDVVSLHTPLTKGTNHLIDADRLAAMKADAVLVNAARGGVLDEAALVNALKDGRLGGAALDVFETEPLDAAAAAKFANVPNLILTPHIGGVTAEANERVSALIADKVAEHLGHKLAGG